MPAWIPFAEVQRQYAALEERLAVISTHCLDTRRFGRGRDIAYGFFGWLYPDFVRIVTQPQFEKDFLYLTVPLTNKDISSREMAMSTMCGIATRSMAERIR